VLLGISEVCAINDTLELRKSAVRCVGVISRIEVTHTTSHPMDDYDDNVSRGMYVKYTVDGREYEVMAGDYGDKAREGDSVVIYYNRDDPSRAKKSLSLVPHYVGMVIFLILALTGVFMFVFSMRRYFIRRRLLRLGNIVQADFESVECNESVEINGRHPYKICCNWRNEEEGAVYSFVSDRLLYDPTEIIAL